MAEGSNGRLSGPDSSLSRRRILQTGLGTTLTGVLAGCTSTGGGGGSGSSVTAGFLYPTSGPYGAIGKQLKMGAQLGVKHTVERDAYKGEIDEVYRDTKTKPGVGTKRAREVINNEGADIIFGAWSSAVGLAIQRVVRAAEIPFQTYIGTNKITGGRCSAYTFDLDPSAAQQANGTVSYALKQKGSGTKVYQIYADYAWGQSHHRYLKNRIIPRFNAELVGSSAVPLGKGEYSSVISQAKKSEADIVYMTLAGTDAVAGITQAYRFGLMDQAVTPFPLVSGPIARGVDPEALAHESFIGGTPWYWRVDTQATDKFVKEFRSEFNQLPLGYAAVAYESVRTSFDALGQAGGPKGSSSGRKSNFPLTEWRKQTEGKETVPGLHNLGVKFRACDHRGTIPHLAVRGLDPGQADQDAGEIFKVVNQPQNPKTLMRPCSRTGCNLPSTK